MLLDRHYIQREKYQYIQVCARLVSPTASFSVDWSLSPCPVLISPFINFFPPHNYAREVWLYLLRSSELHRGDLLQFRHHQFPVLCRDTRLFLMDSHHCILPVRWQLPHVRFRAERGARRGILFKEGGNEVTGSLLWDSLKTCPATNKNLD